MESEFPSTAQFREIFVPTLPQMVFRLQGLVIRQTIGKRLPIQLQSQTLTRSLKSICRIELGLKP